MKKYLFLLIAAFFTAGIFSYTIKQGTPDILTTESYISCFTAEVIEQFKEEASTMAFANMHLSPAYFKLKDPKGKRITFSTPNGKDAMAYLISSKKKSDNYIFVLQEWWGLNDYIMQESDRLHDKLENVNVIALDMYDGKVASTPDSAMKLVQAAKTPRLENSRPENNVEKLKKLSTDVLGIFGNLDKSPSPQVVAQFEKDMQAAGKILITKKYEAGHGFANPSNPVYNKEAAEDAHKHTIEYFKARIN